MNFILPVLDKYYCIPIDTVIKLRINYGNSRHYNQEFYRQYDMTPLTDNSILVTIPANTLIKITKANLSKLGKMMMGLAILSSKNKETEWKWPTIHFSLPIDEFEKIIFEDMV